MLSENGDAVSVSVWINDSTSFPRLIKTYRTLTEKWVRVQLLVLGLLCTCHFIKTSFFPDKALNRQHKQKHNSTKLCINAFIFFVQRLSMAECGQVP